MISYIEVLVGAQSFSDFINRVGAVSTIMEADQTLIDEHPADKKLVEEKQAKIETDLAHLESMRGEPESLKGTLAQQKEDKSNLVAILEQQVLEKEDFKLTLEEEQSILANQEKPFKRLFNKNSKDKMN